MQSKQYIQRIHSIDMQITYNLGEIKTPVLFFASGIALLGFGIKGLFEGFHGGIIIAMVFMSIIFGCLTLTGIEIQKGINKELII